MGGATVEEPHGHLEQRREVERHRCASGKHFQSSLHICSTFINGPTNAFNWKKEALLLMKMNTIATKMCNLIKKSNFVKFV